MFFSRRTEFLLSHELQQSFCFSWVFLPNEGKTEFYVFLEHVKIDTRLEKRASCAAVLGSILTSISSVHGLSKLLQSWPGVFSVLLFLGGRFGACRVLPVQEVPTGVRYHALPPPFAGLFVAGTVGCVSSSQVVVQVVSGSLGLDRGLLFLSGSCHLQRKSNSPERNFSEKRLTAPHHPGVFLSHKGMIKAQKALSN